MRYDAERIRDNVGQVMKTQRKRKGMTQIRLATKAGCSESVVHLTEAGYSSDLRMTSLLKILNALDMPADEFLSKCQEARE